MTNKYRCSFCFENYCENSPSEKEILEWQVEMVHRKKANEPPQEPLLICTECREKGEHLKRYKDILIDTYIGSNGEEIKFYRREEITDDST